MIKLRFLQLVVCSLFLTLSCSPDSDGTSTVQTSTVSSYVVTDVFSNGTGNPQFVSVLTANLLEGKLHSETVEKFVDGESEGVVTSQIYFYNSGKLTKMVEGGNSISYFYSEAGELISATREVGPDHFMYYRFVNLAGTVYFERLTLPANNAETEIERRYIITFDENDNIITAGQDSDFDGIAENVYYYTYLNGNMTSVHSGSEQNLFSHSMVKDNFSYLRDFSFGKKFMRITCAELYVNGQFQKINQSINIKDSEFLLSDYELAENGYYKKKIQVSAGPNGKQTITTEFYFD